MRWLLVLALAAAACKGKTSGSGSGSGSGSEPGSGSGSAAITTNTPDMALAKRTLGCVFDKAQFVRQVFSALEEDTAPIPLLRLAVMEAVDRTRPDGITPTHVIIADGIEVLTKVDDLDGLRALFALVDVDPTAKNELQFNHDGPQRARLGLPMPNDFDSDRGAVVRELALAGDIAGAEKQLAKVNLEDLDATYYRVPYIQALVALGKLDDAKAALEKAPDEDRVRIASAWLDTAMRKQASLDVAVAVAIAELKRAPEGKIILFGERELLRRAQRTGNVQRLAPVYAALFARLATSKNQGYVLFVRHQVATALGDTKELAALAKDPAIVPYLKQQNGTLDQRLAEALAQKYPGDSLARLWLASLAPDADPAFAGRLAQKICPPPPPRRAPATPAAKGLKITVTENKRAPKFECELQDLVVRLTDGKKTLGEEKLEGGCHGACTAKEKREGEREYQRILKEIEKGEASESETDYNFTSCIYSGPLEGRIDQVAGRDVALFADHYIGPHDVDSDRWQIATEVCGELFVSETFAQRYAGGFQLNELKITETPDHGKILVEAVSDRWRGVALRVTLPECPGVATEESLATE